VGAPLQELPGAAWLPRGLQLLANALGDSPPTVVVPGAIRGVRRGRVCPLPPSCESESASAFRAKQKRVWPTAAARRLRGRRPGWRRPGAEGAFHCESSRAATTSRRPQARASALSCARRRQPEGPRRGIPAVQRETRPRPKRNRPRSGGCLRIPYKGCRPGAPCAMGINSTSGSRNSCRVESGIRCAA
jgi:hypothetical protein